jgi:intracellular septation protein
VTGLLTAARALLLDLASTIFFLALYALTHNLSLSVSLGIALAAAQIGWRPDR